MPRDANAKVMCVEDADEFGEVKPGTKPRYAKSNAPSSPTKEMPNTGRSRGQSKRESMSARVYLSDSELSSEPSSSSRKGKKKPSKDEKRNKRAPVVVKEREVLKRPVARTLKSTPALPSRSPPDESSYYGVSPAQRTIAASSSRPRSARPVSYNGGHPFAPPPPLSKSAYYAQPHPSHGPPTSFPPPSFYGGPPATSIPMHPAPPYAPHPADMIVGNRSLSARFGSLGGRPQSAMGFHESYDGFDHEPSKDKSLVRRPSGSRKTSKEHDDRRKMPPPPPRPASARPPREHRLVHRPAHRKSVGFQDDDFDGGPDMYHDVHRALQPRPRRHSFVEDDELDSYQLEPAYSSRRNSGYNFEEKFRDAARYQDGVSGGDTAPLTLESLKYVKPRGGSSRSSRSIESRDESDWKHSATTRTTRSGSGDDDITIKVPNGAVVEVGKTRITCRDGGDLSIGRSGGTSRGGSDRATSVYEDDFKSRPNHTVGRARAQSQAGSYYHRTAPYATHTYPQSYAAPYPPYPAYPDHDYSNPFDPDEY